MDAVAALLQVIDDDDDLTVFAALLGVLILGAQQAHSRQVRARHPSRRYLSRPQLLPNPRIATPWVQLYNSMDDRAYITTMGFDVETFHYLLDNGFRETWNSTPIPRMDVSRFGQPRLSARSLDAAGALGLTLHFLSSAMREVSLQQIFALIPTTVNRYLDFSFDILLTVLRQLPEAGIQFPDVDEIYEYNQLIRARHSRLIGGFGSIDGLSLPCQAADDPEVENATYNGWKSSHFITNILVFSPKGTIFSAVLNAPGSWHDSHTARPIFKQLREKTPEGYYLIADSAFPNGTAAISGKIKAPLKSGARLPDDARKREECLAFDRQLLSYRQTAEWGMRALQGSFGRLRVPLDVNDSRGRQRLLEVCVRLNNVRAQLVGINQIRAVYMPIWKAAEDAELWDNLGNLFFQDIRRRDRVARFHLVTRTT